MLEPQSRNHRSPVPVQDLLAIHGMIKPQAVAERQESQITDEAIFVFKAVTERGPSPAPLPVLALILKPGAIHVGKVREGKVNGTKARGYASGIRKSVLDR